MAEETYKWWISHSTYVTITEERARRLQKAGERIEPNVNWDRIKYPPKDNQDAKAS